MLRRELLALMGATAITQPVMAQSEDASATLPEVQDMVLGQDDAPVTVIEYASFTCPHCASFHLNTFKDLKSEYIDTGKVRFILREVYFDRPGLWAAMTARCTGAEKYFPFTDLIFERQAEWTRAEEPSAIAENLKRLGRIAGMTDDVMDACLQDGDMAKALVATYKENVERDGIRSTPSFLINGNLHTGDKRIEDMRALIDAELN